jgi:hypothetical protein
MMKEKEEEDRKEMVARGREGGKEGREEGPPRQKFCFCHINFPVVCRIHYSTSAIL